MVLLWLAAQRGVPDRTAPWVTTHLFNFGETWGEATLVSEGYSIDDLGIPLDRAIVGGTGPYSKRVASSGRRTWASTRPTA